MPRSNPGGLTIALAGPSDDEGRVTPESGTPFTELLESGPPSSTQNVEFTDASSVPIPQSPTSPKHQSRSFFSGYRTTRFGKQRNAPDFPPERLPSNASSNSLNTPGPQLLGRPISPSPSQASQSPGNVVETASISDRSGLGSSAASEQDAENDWTPESGNRSGHDLFAPRHPPASKHVFHQLINRSRSTKADMAQQRQPQRPHAGRRHLEPVLTEESYQEPPMTAPLEIDRNYRELMTSSATRNKSADRTTIGSKEGSESNFKPGTSWEGTSMLPPSTKSSGSKAPGSLGKVSRVINRLTRSGGEPTQHVFVHGYQFQNITQPLDEQTRRTRICKRLEEAKDKTEFWMPSLAYRCIDYLNLKGIEVEGLYRVSGSALQIQRYQIRFDTEGDVNLLEDPELLDVHTIGSMLKWWLRNQDPWPKQSQEKVVAYIQRHENETEVPPILKDQLSLLPPYNYYLLFAITCHLAILRTNEPTNKMTWHNILVCFGPCITIDQRIFKFLVCDWRNCWQGCWTEKEWYDNGGYGPSVVPALDPASVPTLAPTSSAGYGVSNASFAEDQAFSYEHDNRPDSGDRVASPGPALRGFSRLAIREGMRDDSSSVYENLDNTPQTPSRTGVGRSTPPMLGPLANLSPMRM